MNKRNKTLTLLTVILVAILCICLFGACKKHTEHTYGEWEITREASCTQKGERARKCTGCDDKQTEEIPMLEHEVAEYVTTKEPSCGEKGLEAGTCAKCGNEVTRELDALQHETSVWNKDANTHWRFCERCQQKYNEEEHDMTDNGCSVCRYGSAVNAELTYQLLSDGTYAVTGVANASAATAVVVPDVHPDDNKPVTVIKANAFKLLSNVTSVTLGKNVTSVETNAFYMCFKLTSVKFYSTEVKFNKNSFYFLSKLEDVVFDEGVTTITVASKYDDLFKSCNKLNKIVLSSTVTSIPANLLKPDTLSVIEVADGNTVYKTVENVLYNKTTMKILVVPKGISGVVNIAEGVETIEAMTFHSCFKLTEIKLPDTVLTIKDDAFMSSGITSMVIPDSVTKIGNNIFSNCQSLKSVHFGSGCTTMGDVFSNAKTVLDTLTVSENNSAYKSVNNCLLSKDGTKLYRSNKQGEIPSGVTSFGGYAFADNNEITTVKIPEGITILSNHLFDGCTNLTSVTLPKSLVTISSYVFNGCGITQIVIPASVKNISSYALDGLANLASVTFEDTSGWKITPNGSGTAAEIDVTNAETNAGYFKNEYYTYRWSKT